MSYFAKFHIYLHIQYINSESLFSILLTREIPASKLWYNINNILLTLPIWNTLKLHFEFMAKIWNYSIFSVASIAATEKRPLSYKMPQSVHGPHLCGVQRHFLWKCITGVKNRGAELVGFWPLVNSILFFGFQTTVQSFIKIDWEL